MMNNTFTPQNTDDTLYIIATNSMLTMIDIIAMIKEHFGSDVDLDDVTIHSEYVHTRHITYDLYDPSDYDNFIVITKL